MKIINIHHSSYYVELEKTILIFDYFRPEHFDKVDFTGILPTLNLDKQIYFFVSHGHMDHYDPVILDYARDFDNVKLVISKDVKISRLDIMKKKIKDKILFVDYLSKYKLDDLAIETLKSNEAGVAFVIDVEGKCIYHAGDLNIWYWEGIGELMNNKDKSAFKAQIGHIRDRKIDIAFVPLDKRLEGHTFDGIRYFMENVSAKYIFPTHTWGDYSVVEEYKSMVSNASFANRLMDVNKENQFFEL